MFLCDLGVNNGCTANYHVMYIFVTVDFIDWLVNILKQWFSSLFLWGSFHPLKEIPRLTLSQTFDLLTLTWPNESSIYIKNVLCPTFESQSPRWEPLLYISHFSSYVGCCGVKVASAGTSDALKLKWFPARKWLLLIWGCFWSFPPGVLSKFHPNGNCVADFSVPSPSSEPKEVCGTGTGCSHLRGDKVCYN